MPGVLVVEFKAASLKVLELVNTNSAVMVSRAATIALPVNVFRDGVVSEVKTIAAKLSAFAKENSIAATQAIALVEMPYALAKIIRLPHNLSDEQIRLNLETELNQYRLFAGSDLVVDFKKLEEISEEGVKKVNVLFAACRRQLVVSCAEALKPAGLELIAIDLPLLSVIRLLESSCLDASSLEVSLVILLDEKILQMAIVKGARSRFLHSIELENSDFEKNISGFINRLISAIKLVTNFYQARFMQGEEITRLIVIPQDKRYQKASALLKASFSAIPVAEVDYLHGISFSPHTAGREEIALSYAALIGAGLRVTGKPRPEDLNLAREQKGKEQRRVAQLYLLLVGLVFSCGLAAFFFGAVVLQSYLLKGKVKKLSQRLERPSPELNTLIAIKKEEILLAALKEEAISLISANQNERYFKGAVKVMNAVPTGLWLIEVNLDKEKGLLINGGSTSEKPIFEYLAELSNSGYFSGVELLSSRGEAETIKFSIGCKF